jgi:acyl carrier protein
MTRSDMRQMLLDWLDDNYHFGDATTLIPSDDASFLDNGVLDSLGFVALILVLEDRFHLTIDRKSLNRENFDSLNKILDYVIARVGDAP